ncbi:MAG: hypothetical protein ACI9MC_003319 [Kiritimatiellia bacterium]|jgi:hypothetical protein
MPEKIAVVVFVEHAQPADRGRMAHALHLAQDLKHAGADFKLIFAGKAVEWLPELTHEDRASQHPFVKAYGNVFDEVRDHVEACNFCCIRFKTHDAVQGADISIRGEGKDHMKLGALVMDGYRLVTI